jgi:hypothetical protein
MAARDLRSQPVDHLGKLGQSAPAHLVEGALNIVMSHRSAPPLGRSAVGRGFNSALGTRPLSALL